MKTKLVTIKNQEGQTYEALLFVCPGCAAGGPEKYDGLHQLPVNTDVTSPAWRWNGDLEKPTLHPSILSQGSPPIYPRCHSFLTDGMFNFLTDSTHPLSGQSVPIPDLPDWAEDVSDDVGDDDG